MAESNAPERTKVVLSQSGTPVAIHRGLPLPRGCTLADVVSAEAYDRAITELDEHAAELDAVREVVGDQHLPLIDAAKAMQRALNDARATIADNDALLARAIAERDEARAERDHERTILAVAKPAYGKMRDRADRWYREAPVDLLGNVECRCDHPLRAGMGPCAVCRARAAFAEGEQSTTETSLTDEQIKDVIASVLAAMDEVGRVDIEQATEDIRRTLSPPSTTETATGDAFDRPHPITDAMAEAASRDAWPQVWAVVRSDSDRRTLILAGRSVIRNALDAAPATPEDER